MNQAIIRMARKVWGESAVLPFNELEQFADLVAAAKQEECAALIEPMGDYCGGHGEPSAPSAQYLAAAIRAIGKS